MNLENEEKTTVRFEIKASNLWKSWVTSLDIPTLEAAEADGVETWERVKTSFEGIPMVNEWVLDLETRYFCPNINLLTKALTNQQLLEFFGKPQPLCLFRITNLFNAGRFVQSQRGSRCCFLANRNSISPYLDGASH